MPKIAHVDTQTSTPNGGSAALASIARPADQGGKAARSVAEQAEGTAAAARQELRQTVQHSAGGAAERGRTIIDLLGEQTRQNLETVAALTRAVNWTEIADAQRAFIGDSVERMNRIGEHYRALLQAGMATMSFPARR